MKHPIQTKTLARIYIEQGYPFRAIDILKALEVDFPDDDEIDQLKQYAKKCAIENEVEESKETVTNVGSDEFEQLPDNQLKKKVVAVNSLDTKQEKTVAKNKEIKKVGIREVLKKKAYEIGSKAVDSIAEKAGKKLSGMIGRFQNRRR